MQHRDVADQLYRVVMNDEEQYSIWPAERDLPPGWREGGPTGPKNECLAYIEKVWTDMRPLSLRQRMDKGGQGQGVG
jgi:MbtH protein